MRSKILLIWLLLCVVLYGCKDNVVCPAFQSTYILNDSVRMAAYSLFLNDSTPKFQLASRRNKYGVNKKTNYYRKNYELMTAPKKNVLKTPEFDSLNFGISQEELLAKALERKESFKLPELELTPSDSTSLLSSTDSLGVLSSDSLMLVGVDSVDTEEIVDLTEPTEVAELSDSTELLASADEVKEVDYKYRYHPKNSFNMEQEYYNKYYGELFVDNRPPPPSPEKLAEMMEQADSVKKASKWNPFKRKEREEKEEEIEDIDDLLEQEDSEAPDEESLEEEIEEEELEENEDDLLDQLLEEAPEEEN